MFNREDILYSQARRVLNQRHTKPPWTNLEPYQERMDETGDNTHLLHEESKHIRPLKSLVVCENFSNKSVEINELSIDEFWDFLYSGEWKGGNSIRVLDGQLLHQLSHSIVLLRRRGKVVAHTTFAYAKNIRPGTRSCHKETDKETISSVEETLLIELTNLGRLTKPEPNRPMDDPVDFMCLQPHQTHQSTRKKQTQPKPQIRKHSKSAINCTSADVPDPTNQTKAKSQTKITVHSPSENTSYVSVSSNHDSQEKSFLPSPPKDPELQRVDPSRKNGKSCNASTYGKKSPPTSSSQERRPYRNAVKLPLLGKRKCEDWAFSQAEYLEKSTKPNKMETKNLLLHRGTLDKCRDKNDDDVKLPRLGTQKIYDRAICLAEHLQYSAKLTNMKTLVQDDHLDANENEIPIKKQFEKKEEYAVEFRQQQSIDDLGEVLYLGNEVVPPEVYEAGTAATKLKMRKQELQKERELTKLLMKQMTERKPFLPNLKPLDSESMSLQFVHYPILVFEKVPTLEDMIRYMKDDARVDPRFKTDESKYKKRKIIRKYNLSRGTIIHVLKGIRRRHAITIQSDYYTSVEEFLKKYRKKKECDNKDDKAKWKHASIEKELAVAKDGKEADTKFKYKLPSVVGAITDSNACKKHVRLHAMTDRSKPFLDVQRKASITPLERGLTLEGTKYISIAAEDIGSIQAVSKKATIALVRNGTLAPLERESVLDNTGRISIGSKECIPKPDVLITTSTGKISTMMKNSKSSPLGSRRSINTVQSEENDKLTALKNASETMLFENGKGQLPKITINDEDSDEPSIPESSEEFDNEEEELLMEVQNFNKFDTGELNVQDSVQKVRTKKLIQKRIPAFMDVLKKYVRVQEIMKKFRKGQPGKEDRMAKERAKNRKVPGFQQDETSRLNMQNVVGTLRAFNFLTKSPIPKQTSRPTPSKFHFPTSYTTEKFLLKFSQALDDFVVRREIVISNRNWKCSNSVTFTRKTVFTMHRM